MPPGTGPQPPEDTPGRARPTDTFPFYKTQDQHRRRHPHLGHNSRTATGHAGNHPNRTLKIKSPGVNEWTHYS